MKIVSSFKNMEHTESLDEKVHSKSQKLHKYFEGNFDVHWTCYVREDGAHCADIKVSGPNFEYHASAYSDSLYKTLDLVISKITKQVQKKKEKWKSFSKQKYHQSFKEAQKFESLKDEEFWDEKFEEDLAS